jgi:hypothetical protein
MPVMGEEYAFEHDLKDFDINKTLLILPTFSVGGSKLYLQLNKREGESNYGCFLHCSDTLNFPGTIHYRFDLVKKLDNRIVKTKT